ncbi:hypothetical protein B0H13DRAFT_1888810 [Mycena leptocephala]|nr:hypothetical protein B0H13DRAFT_1888810 [Mycena leptocephala]
MPQDGGLWNTVAGVEWRQFGGWTLTPLTKYLLLGHRPSWSVQKGGIPGRTYGDSRNLMRGEIEDSRDERRAEEGGAQELGFSANYICFFNQGVAKVVFNAETRPTVYSSFEPRLIGTVNGGLEFWLDKLDAARLARRSLQFYGYVRRHPTVVDVRRACQHAALLKPARIPRTQPSVCLPGSSISRRSGYLRIRQDTAAFTVVPSQTADPTYFPSPAATGRTCSLRCLPNVFCHAASAPRDSILSRSRKYPEAPRVPYPKRSFAVYGCRRISWDTLGTPALLSVSSRVNSTGPTSCLNLGYSPHRTTRDAELVRNFLARTGVERLLLTAVIWLHSCFALCLRRASEVSFFCDLSYLWTPDDWGYPVGLNALKMTLVFPVHWLIWRWTGMRQALNAPASVLFSCLVGAKSGGRRRCRRVPHEFGIVGKQDRPGPMGQSPGINRSERRLWVGTVIRPNRRSAVGVSGRQPPNVKGRWRKDRGNEPISRASVKIRDAMTEACLIRKCTEYVTR